MVADRAATFIKKKTLLAAQIDSSLSKMRACCLSSRRRRPPRPRVTNHRFPDTYYWGVLYKGALLMMLLCGMHIYSRNRLNSPEYLIRQLLKFLRFRTNH
jgi:hypothetical protein